MKFIDWLQTIEESDVGRDTILFISKIKRDNFDFDSVYDCVEFYRQSQDWNPDVFDKLIRLVKCNSSCQECHCNIELGGQYCVKHSCRTPTCKNPVNKTEGGYNYYCKDHLNCGELGSCEGCQQVYQNNYYTRRAYRSRSVGYLELNFV